MENLKRFRKAKGLKQKELADLVGVSESSISQYENGKKNPSFEIALKLAEALDCESADLVSTRENIGPEIKKTATSNGDGKDQDRHDYVNSLFDQLNFQNQIDVIDFLKMKLQVQQDQDVPKGSD